MIQSCAGNFASGLLIDRKTLSCQSSLVNCACALKNNSVDRNILAGADHEHVTAADLVDIDGDFCSASDDICSLRSKLHKRLQRVGRLALRVSLKHLADRDQRENHRGRLKIELHHVLFDESHISIRLSPGHRK